jgi:hypothetical protein
MNDHFSSFHSKNTPICDQFSKKFFIGIMSDGKNETCVELCMYK